MKQNLVVHKEGSPETILLTLSGRIETEPFDLPEWAAEGIALAKLSEREHFYKTRLGPMSEAMLGSNVINYDDLSWVAVNTDGDEFVIEADEEFRMGVLASALGVDREQGIIDGAITDYYIDQAGSTYTGEEVAELRKAEAEAFAKTA